MVSFSADFSGSVPACMLHYNHLCHLCGRHSAQAQQTQKNRYQEVKSRWCNVTGTQIRAAFLPSSAASHVLDEKRNRPTCDKDEMLLFVKKKLALLKSQS